MTSVQIKNTLAAMPKAMFWYVYLALLIWMSFVAVRYESIARVELIGVFYLYAAVYLTAVMFGLKVNRNAIYAARYVLVFSVVIILWLTCQMALPNAASDLLSQNNAPDWFTDLSITNVDLSRSRGLWFANVFVLTWFMVTLSLLTSRRRAIQLLTLILLVGLFHALSGLFAKYTNVILVDRQSIDGHFSAARAWFVNRNHFAAFIGLSLIGSITFFVKALLQERRQRILVLVLDFIMSPKILYLIAPTIGLIAIALSHSRAGLFGFIAAFFLVMGAASYVDSRVGNNKKVILGVFLSVVLLLGFFGQDIVNRLASQSLSVGERAQQWQVTWQGIKQAPLLGYGGGSYATVFQIFRDGEEFRQVTFDQAHNEYLHIWMEQGLIGLVLWLGLLLSVVFSAIAAYRASNSTFVTAVLLSGLVVLIAASVQALVDFNLQIINIRIYLFVVIALMLATPSVHQRKRDKHKNN